MEENKKPEPMPVKHKKVVVFIDILLVIFSVIAFGVAGVLIYQKRYLSPFWVNGQSMYPTLNQYASRPDGSPLGVGGGSAYDGCKNLDYGVMDQHARALKKIKRFDIVVCKYDFGDEYDKIKRIVGMPGETIRFGQGEDNGSFYVIENGEPHLIEQPLSKEYIAAGFYPSGDITLASDEYYVLGDNRNHSSDSRNNEPIKFEWLVGKVVCVCAHCEIRQSADGSLEPFNIDHFIPRFL